MNFFYQPSPIKWRFTKLLRIMRITTILLLIGLIQTYATNTYSQNTKLSLKMEDASLENILSEIEKVSEFHFFYRSNEIYSIDKYTIDANEQTIDELLNSLLKNSKLTYKIFDKYIAIVSKENVNENIENVFQQKSVTGKVSDQSGVPIPGASVIVKGTTIGVATDNNGNFSLTLPSDAKTLVFSFVGMKTQELAIIGKTSINITMIEEIIGIEEVVAIGYGTIKKENLTGAVAHVDSKKLENRPLSDVAKAMQGMMANVMVNTTEGTPGQESSFQIRGNTSINGGGPVVLIDGVEGRLDMINPDDVESVSVLKDAASAAIYGGKAAFGVILVTTKKGVFKSKPVIRYNGKMAFNTLTVYPKFANSLEFIEYSNTMMKNSYGTTLYPDGLIDLVKKNMENPKMYPGSYPTSEVGIEGGAFSANGWTYCANTDWIHELYRTWSPEKQHNLSISGGTKDFNYYMSGSLFDQDGMYKYGNDTYKKYNTTLRVEAAVTNWMKVEMKVNLNNTDYNHYTDVTGNKNRDFLRRPSLLPLKNTDGHYAYWFNAAIYMDDGGRTIDKQGYNVSSVGVEINPFKGASIKGNYTWDKYDILTTSHLKTVYYYKPDGTKIADSYYTTPNSYTESYYNKKHSAISIYADYEHNFESKHYIKAMIGYSQEYSLSMSFAAHRKNLVSDDLPSIVLATGEESVWGGSSDWALRSAFSRINYNYDGKYLLEINTRYDGSSKFPKNSRYGFFPSTSIGWRISKESFMDFMRPLVNDLKIRASYGSLGNQYIANDNNYPYIPLLSTSDYPNWLWNNQHLFSAYPAGLVSANFSWEKVNTINFGFDNLMFNNQLNMSFDIYRRNTKGMLAQSASLPGVLGTDTPKSNNADLKTDGYEVSINWKDRIGRDLNYSITASFGDAISTITKYNNSTGLIGDFNKGHKLGEIWGYESVGLFQSPQDVANAPDQSKIDARTWMPGDMQYKDLDDNKSIDWGDGTINNPGDKKIIGNSTPRYNYGLNLAVEYKGFDFSAFFQGIGKRDFWFGTELNDNNVLFWPSWKWGSPQKLHLDYWTENNRDAYWPRPLDDENNVKKNSQVQTRYLQDASYLRLKNLTIGYTFPSKLTNKIKMQTVRVYFSGENLWEYTHLQKSFDPEAIYQTNGYPFQRTLSIGIDIHF